MDLFSDAALQKTIDDLSDQFRYILRTDNAPGQEAASFRLWFYWLKYNRTQLTVQDYRTADRYQEELSDWLDLNRPRRRAYALGEFCSEDHILEVH